ncbi:MAG: hypothetical protein R6W78_10655 [Bacteroidales bacterium]
MKRKKNNKTISSVHIIHVQNNPFTDNLIPLTENHIDSITLILTFVSAYKLNMKTMNWSIIIGILLVLIGLSLIMKVVFNIDFPVVRVVIALFFIYLGIKLFIGKDFNIFPKGSTDNAVFFGQRTITTIDDGMEYNIIFSRGIVDLRNFSPKENEEVHIKLNTVFGSSEVIYNDTIPVSIKSTAAFAGTKLPDGNTTSFGSFEYNPDRKPLIYIESATVFGQTIFRKKH